MFTNPERIELCNRALESVRALILADLHQNVFEDINRFNEWGVGMEMLIDQMSDREIRVTLKQFRFIEAAMAAMGLADSARVRYLREHHVGTCDEL